MDNNFRDFRLKLIFLALCILLLLAIKGHIRLGYPNHVGNFCNAPLRADAAFRTVAVQPSWNFIAHFSRFLRPGAVRIGTSHWTPDIETVAARNADGSFAAVLLNRTDNALRPQLRFRGLLAPVDLPPHSIATVVW